MDDYDNATEEILEDLFGSFTLIGGIFFCIISRCLQGHFIHREDLKSKFKQCLTLIAKIKEHIRPWVFGHALEIHCFI